MLNVIDNKYARHFHKEPTLRRFIGLTKDELPYFNLSLYEPSKEQIRNIEINRPRFDGKIILDFDNGIQHEEIIKALPYKAFWYASTSCTQEHDKFRGIIWTDCEEKMDEEIYKEAFNLLMPKIVIDNMDATCTQLSRFFACPNNNLKCYYEIDNTSLPPMHFESGFASMCIASRNAFNGTETALKGSFSKNEYKGSTEPRNALKTQGKCLNYDCIQYYLNKSFNQITGNGDSNSSLYKAIYTCIKYHDELTLEKVLYKARIEKWTNKELERMISSVRNYLH